MKNLCIVLVCLHLALSAFGQSVPKVYSDIVEKFNDQRYETIVALTGDVDRLARTRKDTIVANSFYYIAQSYKELGDPEKAINWFEKEKLMRADLGLIETSEFSGALYHLALVYLEAGQYAKAETMVVDLLANDKRMYGVQSQEYISTIQSAVDIYTQLDKFAEAETLLLESLKLQEKKSAIKAAYHSELGGLYTVSAQYQKATKQLNEALDILEQLGESNSPIALSATVNLGILYMSQGKYAEAEEAFDFVLANMSQDARSAPTGIHRSR